MSHVDFCRATMLLFLMVVASGCDDGHRAESPHNSPLASRGAPPPEAKMQIQPGMSENEAFARMKDMGYIAMPVQDYPSSDGGGISLYAPTDAGKGGHLLVVEWRGPSGHRSVCNHVIVDAQGRDESIPFEKLRELLDKSENSGG